MRLRPFAALSLAAVSAVLLAGCSGLGGGGTTASPTPTDAAAVDLCDAAAPSGAISDAVTATGDVGTAPTVSFDFPIDTTDLATERTVRFTESEFAVARGDVAHVLRELRDYFRRGEQRVAFPIEVRFTGPDDRWLSTGYERGNAYVAVHQYHRRSNQPYFQDFWAMLPDDARPHWGKLHDLGADELRGLYPRFDDFVALRDRLDPDRVFTNAYLDRVLGA